MTQTGPAGEPFPYQITADQRVLIWWQGRLVTTVAAMPGRRLAARLEAGDPAQRQVLLARASGNFKRGNER